MAVLAATAVALAVALASTGAWLLTRAELLRQVYAELTAQSRAVERLPHPLSDPLTAHVPFTLRSGKALGARRASITVHFREVAHPEFRGLGGRANLLQVSLGSPRVSLGLNVNAEGELFALTPVQVSRDLPAPARSAYAGLLHGILRGDPTLSVRGDEAEESWRIVDPVLDAWAVNAVPLTDYVAGSEGPSPHRGAGEASGPTSR